MNGSFSFEAAEAVRALIGSPEPGTPVRRVSMRIEGGEHDRFAESAARSMIGQRPRFKMLGHDMGHGTVVDAQVIDDGRAMMVTIDQTAEQMRGVSPLPPFLGSVADLPDPHGGFIHEGCEDE